MGFVSKALEKVKTQNTTLSNATILKGQGIDLATVLTPAGRRKKRAGLIGQDPEEKIVTVLGG